MCVKSIHFSLPWVKTYQPQVHYSCVARIAALVLGLLTFVCGVLALKGVVGFAALSNPGGITFLCLGTVMAALGSLLRCTKKVHDNAEIPALPLVEPFPTSLNALQEKMMRVYDALTSMPSMSSQGERERCEAFLCICGDPNKNPDPYFDFANYSYEQLLEQMRMAEDVKSQLLEAQQVMQEIFFELCKIYFARNTQSAIDKVREVAVALGFEKGRALYYEVIEKYLAMDNLYALNALLLMPKDFKDAWREWEIFYRLGKKLLNSSSYRTARQVMDQMPAENEWRRKLHDEINTFISKNPKMASPYKFPTPSFSRERREGVPRKLFGHSPCDKSDLFL